MKAHSNKNRLTVYGEEGFVQPQSVATFELPDDFVEQYRSVEPPFGFNGMGYFVYKRTYSRIKPNGQNEEWYETIRRVVEGTFSMQKRHIQRSGLGWKEDKALRHAKEMYDRIFHMKMTPPGRGLWAMGSGITEERGMFAALNNCAFVSTEDIAEDLSKPFEFLMDMSMLGVGVGFDVRGAGEIRVHRPKFSDGEYSIGRSWNTAPDVRYGELLHNDMGHSPMTYVIPDTREGWVESLRLTLLSYFQEQTPAVEFDYSQIRERGALIRGFGGRSSGPEPLRKLHVKLRELLDRQVGEELSVKLIVDIMNLIGKAVVAGNVRRTAEIVFGDPDDETYMDLKNPEVFPERNAMDDSGWGWTSNNSIFAEIGQDYYAPAKRTQINGEPGYAWLENMQRFGRMQDPPNDKDYRAKGGNPCLEQTLEPYELCCLVEINANAHDSYEDYLKSVKYAYMYAKTVTLGKTHWPETNRVMLRNRRIGTSVTGVAQFADQRGLDTLRTWLDDSYDYIQELDKTYSDWFSVPRSIKTTSVKPSGTVSKVMGVWPGLHRPDNRYTKRRVRVASNHPTLDELRDKGYHTEPDVRSPEDTVCVEFPVDYGEGRTNQDVSIWEQVSFAAFMQRWWADNQVSCTVSFDRESEGDQIQHVLNHFQYDLKGISFLGRVDLEAGEEMPYAQMPEEPITKEEYDRMLKQTSRLDFSDVNELEGQIEKFCQGESCQVDFS